MRTLTLVLNNGHSVSLVNLNVFVSLLTRQVLHNHEVITNILFVNYFVQYLANGCLHKITANINGPYVTVLSDNRLYRLFSTHHNNGFI